MKSQTTFLYMLNISLPLLWKASNYYSREKILSAQHLDDFTTFGLGISYCTRQEPYYVWMLRLSAPRKPGNASVQGRAHMSAPFYRRGRPRTLPSSLSIPVSKSTSRGPPPSHSHPWTNQRSQKWCKWSSCRDSVRSGSPHLWRFTVATSTIEMRMQCCGAGVEPPHFQLRSGYSSAVRIA